MRRLVVVSNRLPSVKLGDPPGQVEIPLGGLASALAGALRRSPNSLWFGWNGRVVEPSRRERLSRAMVSDIELLGLPLAQKEVDRYYLGFCNETLWPAFHCFQGRVRVRPESWACYRSVQSRMASVLLPFLQPDDAVWVHDYHLLLLGSELRRLGFRGQLGFFLHTPFPPYDLWQVLPEPREILRALMQYDVMGFHIQTYRDNYVYCAQRELGARLEGCILSTGERSQRVGAFPVGIEPDDFAPQRDVPPPSTERRRRQVLRAVLRDRKLVLGVDRLDYSKGIPERIGAYEQFLRKSPDWHKRVIYVQIASPSRTPLLEYARQKARIESLMGRINGELGEHDWQPVRYLYKAYKRDFLAKLYREADVGLVTPLRDGMNLVAKEYVAAQHMEYPGVLVLSRTAGAAEELRDALLVNPYVPSEVAAAIQRALAMPWEERRERHARLLAQVRAHTATRWADDFVSTLRLPSPRVHRAVALDGAG